MANKLEPIEINGTTVWVEVSELEPVVRPASRSDDPLATRNTDATRSGKTQLDQLTKVDIAETLAAVISPVRQALEGLGPEEVSVELSLGLSGKVGIFVAETQGSAALKVTAKWKPKPASNKT